MQLTLALAALATAVYAQDCSSSYDGTFQLVPMDVSSTKRSIEARQSCGNALTITLEDGVLKDAQGRIGSIVANYQFQFDGPPPQAGTLVSDGFTACADGKLASNGETEWYRCSDEDRTSIYGPNLAEVGDKCVKVFYMVQACGASSSGDAMVTVAADGQPGVTSAPCSPITQMVDGQPVVSSCPTTSTCVPITQMSDGQPVVTSCPTPSSTSECVAVTQMIDGQPVISSCASSTTSECVAITQMMDGQPVISSCPTSTPTSECVAITQMMDGQPVISSCPTSTPTSVQGQSNDVQVMATGALQPAMTPFRGSGSTLTVRSQIAAAVLGAVMVALL